MRHRHSSIFLLLCLLSPVSASAQAGDPVIRLFDPLEWTSQQPTAFTAPAGTRFRVEGLAYHPAGIRAILVAGLTVTDREVDELTNGERFSTFITLREGITSVDIVLQPNQGQPFSATFPVVVEPGDPVPVEAGLPAAEQTRYNPSTALARGLLFPGLGQFYTDRTGTGMLFLGAAAGSIVAGIALSHPAKLECDEFDRCTELEAKADYILPAIGVAVGLAVIGAIEARSYAKRLQAESESSSRGTAGSGIRFHMPRLSATPTEIRLTLVRARF